MKRIIIVCLVGLLAGITACNNTSSTHDNHNADSTKNLYTCPMPQDSVFSNKPGKCPKCGMDLVKVQHDQFDHAKEVYTCPMHPQIIKDKPGSCPICGMKLVRKESGSSKMTTDELEALLQPTNEYVVSSIPVTTMQKKEEQIEIDALGIIAYDSRAAGSMSSRVSGRIEKLYVRYRYQKIAKGQHIMDVYSPELLTAQQNLLFLIKNDPDNKDFISAAKEKLLFLGMSSQQLENVIARGKPSLSIAVYSNYNGHIHEANIANTMASQQDVMRDISLQTEELKLKEGMYVQKGQSIFTVFNPDRAWAVLNLFGDNQNLIEKGNVVRIVPETSPDKNFRATIDFIEPFYRADNKTSSVRVYFDNTKLKIPVGSQVRATIFGKAKDANWLPEESVLSLGLDKVVFKKVAGGFKAARISTGIIERKHIQVVNGLTVLDSVAINAQYLMDSESFIKVKNER